MADDLDTFLKREAAPAPEPERPEQQSEPAAPEPEAKEPDAPPPEGEPEPEQQDGRHVPLRALEAERKQRQDWKDRAARAETQAAEHAKQLADLQRQLEEVRKAAPQQAQPEPQAPQFIDPREDPQGFLQRLAERDINAKLNTSEMLLRREIGGEAVDNLISEFREAAKADPVLAHQLYQQPDPYAWANEQMRVRRFQREIGTDPEAYKAKLRAEIEAELQAPQGQPQPQRPAIPQQAPSLARVNSAAPRSSAAFTGPPSLGDVLGRR